jgi:predicted regulator of Ras-like GTPase activity (Roadblock/LC7/MglB family)
MNVDFAELDDRIAKCQKILDADPNSQIFAALAEAYRKKRMVDKALDVCRKGLEIHPDYSSAYIVLSKIFMDQGNFEEADRQLNNAIRTGGRTRSADILQSEILIKLGQREKAKTILGKLQKSDPQNDTVRRLLVSIESDNSMAGMESVRMPEHPHPVEQPRHEEAPKRAYTLSNALSIIKVLPRVLGVVAVGMDGIVIEGHFDGMLSKDELGALASGAFGSIGSGIGKVNLGRPHEVLIESEQSKLWMLSHDKMLIIVSMRDDVNLGSLKLKVNEIFKNTLFT